MTDDATRTASNAPQRSDETSTGETVPLSPGSSGPRVADLTATIEAGTSVGRYTVRAHIGSGGMGDVYAAHDPELNRAVAIKVVQPKVTGRSSNAALRFQREAQALARLNHPNVVAIYDVGTVGGSVFVAMELIEGPTLSAWLAERPREVAEIVEVFVQAGRGLAAAHAAGITHRDFKPSNVMLGDRVRVVDFGLARPADEDTGDGPITPSALDTIVTRSDDVLGTPAYMAPEQLRSARGGPLADQYSFAVALHEALTGVRPGKPLLRPVPAWLRPVLARALQAQPSARFPAMDALLARLVPRPPTRRWWAVAAVVLAAAGAGAIWAWPSGPPPCTGAEAQLAGAWDAERSQAVHAAFTATKLGYADATWQRVHTSLDGYRKAWIDMRVAACRATRVEGFQSEAVMDLRMACLDQRRSRLAALTQLWVAGVDGKALEAAGDAVVRLPAIAECDQAQAARPSDPATAASVATARAELDKVWALSLAGRAQDAQRRLPAVTAAADATGWPQLQAEARYLEGHVRQALVDPAAEATLLDASRLASAAHDDRLSATALVDLVQHLAANQQSADRALLVAGIAEGAIARIGDDGAMRCRLLRFRGEALYTASKYAEAKQLFVEAQALASQVFGADSDEAAANLTDLVAVASAAGDNTEAVRIGEQALARTEALFGPNHPRVAAILNRLGVATYNLSHYDIAAGYYARSVAIMEASSGPDSAAYAHALTRLGATEIQRGHWREARTELERALAIRERVLGADHPLVAETLDALSSVLIPLGELDQALRQLEREQAIFTKAYGAADRRVSNALEGIADLHRARGELDEALRYHRQVLDLREKAIGADHPRTADAMTGVASVLRELGRCREAGPLAARAIAVFEKAEADASNAIEVRAACELAEHHTARAAVSAQQAVAACVKTSETYVECASKYWVLARALDASGKPREALAAATVAEQQIARSDTGMNKTEVAALRAWLAAHRK